MSGIIQGAKDSGQAAGATGSPLAVGVDPAGRLKTVDPETGKLDEIIRLLKVLIDVTSRGLNEDADPEMLEIGAGD